MSFIFHSKHLHNTASGSSKNKVLLQKVCSQKIKQISIVCFEKIKQISIGLALYCSNSNCDELRLSCQLTSTKQAIREIRFTLLVKGPHDYHSSMLKPSHARLCSSDKHYIINIEREKNVLQVKRRVLYFSV